MLAYAKFSPAHIYEVHFDDAQKTFNSSFEKQVLDVGNGVPLGRNNVLASLMAHLEAERTQVVCNPQNRNTLRNVSIAMMTAR